MSISITIIGHNEEGHLAEVLPSLSWADEIIYVDCESHDRSLDVAARHGCATFSRPNNPNLNVNKSFAMEKATGDWIFYLDPDERIPDDLRDEVLAVVQSPPGGAVAFALGRRNHYFGRWLRHGSKYPDTQLRLFKRGAARFPNRHVHEKLEIDGETGRLRRDMHHHPFLSVSQFLQKFDFYASFEANFIYANGFRPGVKNAIAYCFIKPLGRFVRRYVFKRGFLDGVEGLFAALFDGVKFIVVYAKIRELSRGDAGR